MYVRIQNSLLVVGKQRVARKSCAHATNTIKNIKDRLRCEAITTEQQANFSPYKHNKMKGWSVKAVCLSNKDAVKVPTSSTTREVLLSAGLGERKIEVRNINGSWEEFKGEILATFPKLVGCGGFEIMRCVPNTKDLELVSMRIAQSPKLLKTILGNGRMFLRPIQQDLTLDQVQFEHSSEVYAFIVYLDTIMQYS